MKKELGKGPLIGVIVIGVVVIAAVVYSAFFKNAGYSKEAQIQNDRQAEISDQNFDRVRNSLEGGNASGQNPEAAARNGQ